ncbi:MAG TPA: aminotransferase class I/II-fold pyridoxal phosphate-dependent enzyme [Sedimentisphaerales bacterium]|nr:aminotransferase class I/II-fold pyridoxal phosphate-dependent enzyme [Sedimentisphaerales bacterium]HOC65722.1 aminotransferase class I/II-fold pyridoxal phosphate-dependent enzyme [Sedimentisphaerales bacterium]HOH66813.1 aminotransferase class I/II-fold pyridoxal phosphate-dependent enzyme [Sedimentisphaerales bacterium]HQA92262.1 aminotransferase class I/II-fold pyridoxal phosphate-dependent enzyme [Sedimentisphaerales bacterium]HQN36183.1 aminotransferase class I/II-fold pyridoxal phosp
MRKLVAERTGWIDSSGIRKVFALAAELKDPINFSIGQPDFDVPEPLKREAIKAIEAGMNRYSQTAGDKDLQDKIAAQMTAEFGWANPAVLVASGVSGGLLLAFLALIDPGDEVIVPDPYFVMYKHVVNLLGGKCVFVDSYPDFDLPVEGIARAITRRTKIIVLNSPCNPTGMVYSDERIRALAKVAAEKDILVLTDEIYEQFSYDGPCASIARYHEKVLLMRGFSKSYAMTGWRLAYVAASASMRPVLEEMIKIQQYTFVCAPSPFQRAAVAALDYDVSELVAQYVRKRDLLYEGLAGAFELVRPGGAFYAFVKAPNGSSTEFVKKAIQNNVLVIPGNVFSEKDTHFRISFATTDEKIRQGVEVLRRLA